MAGFELKLLGTNFIGRVVETISAAGRGASDFDCPSHCNIIGSVVKKGLVCLASKMGEFRK